MIESNHFEKHFDYGSFLPLVLFILGIYMSLLFTLKNYYIGIFIMLIAFIIYVIHNVVINFKEKNLTEFNQYIEEIAVFVTFGLSPIIFGLSFYENEFIILCVVFFYAICQILNLGRNFVLNAKNSRGWPTPLNGLFFPFTYYIYIFYLQGPGESIFIVYFLLIAVLLVSEYNFLGYEQEVSTQKFNDTKIQISQDEKKIEIKEIVDIKKDTKIQNEILEKKQRLVEEKKILLEFEELKKRKLKTIENFEKLSNSAIETNISNKGKWYDFLFTKKNKESKKLKNIGNEF